VPPSLNFPQLDFVEPSSGFHPVTWERVAKLEYLLKHLGRRKTTFTMPRVKVGEFYGNKNVHMQKNKFYLPKSLLILFSNLLLIKVWLLIKENLSSLLSFCMCYLIIAPGQISKI
jgi:hypothetical protein